MSHTKCIDCGGQRNLKGLISMTNSLFFREGFPEKGRRVIETFIIPFTLLQKLFFFFYEDLVNKK